MFDILIKGGLVLDGAGNQARIEEKPIELYSILHVKHIDKQKKQNKLYDGIS